MGKRQGTFEEVNLGFSGRNGASPKPTAVSTAGSATSATTAIIFCPDVAIRKENGNNVIDYDHCKGCGICVEECPRDAMVMEEEGR